MELSLMFGCTDCVKACMMWLYPLPAWLPRDYRHIEAYITPYILPTTHIALTGS